MQHGIELVGVRCRCHFRGVGIRVGRDGLIDEQRVEKADDARENRDLSAPTGNDAYAGHVAQCGDSRHVSQPSQAHEEKCKDVIDAHVSKPAAKNEVRWLLLLLIGGGGWKKDRC